MFSHKMYRIISFFIIFFISCNTIYSQKNTKKIDSIGKLIDKSYVYGDIGQKEVLKLTTELYYLSREDKLVSGQLTALYEELKIYYLMGDADQALSKINEGISLAKSSKDYNMLCRFLLIYQNLLLQLDYPKESKSVLATCEKYNQLVKKEEDREINTVYFLLSNAAVLEDEEQTSHKYLDSIVSFKKKAYTEALQINKANKLKNYVLLFALESLTISTIQTGDIAQSRKYAAEIDKLLAVYPNKNLLIQNLIIKGSIENMDHNYNAAVSYFSEVISKAEGKIYILNIVYPMISKSYAGLKDFENATAYSWKNKQTIDSISQAKKRSGDAKIISEINLKIFDTNQENTIFTKVNSIVAVIILASLIIGYLFYKRNRRIKTTTVPFLNNETIKANSPVLPAGNTELETTRTLVNLIKEDITIFYLEFQKAYPFFYATLQEKYPELNISDINFCSLIKMNLAVKEIAIHTNSSIKSVESRRYRIIKKMQINNQKELYFIISTLKGS